MSEVAEGNVPAPVDESVETEAMEEGSEAEGQEVTPPPAPTKEQQKQLKKYNITANGKKKEVELDLSDDAAVQRYLEQAHGANQKFEEAAMIRKQAEQLVKMFKDNPIALLKHPDLGLDVKSIAAQILNEEIEDMAKTPEQKKIEAMEKQLKAFEEEKKRLQEEKTQAELQKSQAEAFQQLDEQIDAALSNTELPKSAYVVKRIADTLLEAYELRDPSTGQRLYPNVTVQDILPYVEEQITNEIQEMIGAKPNVLIEKLVGKKNLDNYRKERVAKTKPKVETAAQVKDSGNKDIKKEEPKDANPKKFSQIFGGF